MHCIQVIWHCIHCEVNTSISLVTMCLHANLLQYYLPYSLCCLLQHCGLFFFITGYLYLLIPFTYFASHLSLSTPPVMTNLFSLSINLFSFCLFCFSTYSWDHTVLSLSTYPLDPYMFLQIARFHHLNGWVRFHCE